MIIKYMICIGVIPIFNIYTPIAGPVVSKIVSLFYT